MNAMTPFKSIYNSLLEDTNIRKERNLRTTIKNKKRKNIKEQFTSK